MAETFRERRKRELEGNSAQSDSGLSFREQRKKELSGENYKEFQSNIDTTDLSHVGAPAKRSISFAESNPKPAATSPKKKSVMEVPKKSTQTVTQNNKLVMPNPFQNQPKVSPTLKQSNPNVVASTPASHNPINALYQQLRGNPDGPTSELPSTGSKKLDKVAHFVGETAGQILQNPIGGTEQLLAKTLGNTAARAVPKLAPHLMEEGAQLAKPVANTFMQKAIPVAAKAGVSAITGGIENTAAGASIGQTDGRDMAENFGVGAAFGGVGHLFGRGISKGLDALKARRSTVTPEVEQAVQKAFDKVELVAKAPAGPTKKLGVAYGNLKPASNEQYINKVMGDIKGTVTERMTPPLENPKELAKWLQPHLGDASLNEIRQLPYEDMRQLAEEVRSHLSMYDMARQAAKERGYNLDQILNNETPSIKKTADRLRMGRIAGAVEAPKANVRIATARTGLKPSLESVQKPPSQLKTSAPQLRSESAQAEPIKKPKLTVVPKAKVDELKFAETVRKSDKTSPEFADRLTDTPLTGARTSDKLNQQIAKQMIDKHGAEALANKLLAKKGKLSASEVTAAQMLARHFSESGNLDRAIEVVSKTAREGREMGQAIQALSQWNKLDQEGALLLAERQLNRGTINTEEWKKLTSAQAKPVQVAAKKYEQVQEARDLVDEIVAMIANKPEGEALTDAEKAIINKFDRRVKQINEKVKPFLKQSQKERKSVIDEVTKVPPKERTRDQVVNLLDAKAARARARLNKARNLGFAAVNQGNPAVDYAIIGASHLAKGAVKFADFSEKLVKDFGDGVKPYLHEAYTRASRTFRKANGLPSETELNRVINTAIKQNKLDKGTANALKAMASEIGFYLDDNLKKEATQDLQLAMKGLGDSTLGNKLASAQSSAMLLNAQTFLRNLGGTVQTLTFEKLNKLAAVPIDMALSKFTKERTIKFFPHNQSKLFKDYMTGTVSGYKGISASGSLTSSDIHPETFKSNKNPLKWLSKLTGASIQGMDHAAYEKAAGEVLATYAEQVGKAQGLTSKEIKEQMPELIKKLDKSIYDLADQAGAYATYQDETLLARGAQKVKQGLNKPTDAMFQSLEEMGLPKWLSLRGFGAGDILVKFAKTPANLVMRGLDYSPMGFIRGVYHLIPLLNKSAKFNQFEATRALSRAITGTIGLTGLGYVMADAGILTGAASTDKDMRSIQEQSGQGAYKVNWSAMGRWLMSGFDKDAAKFQKGDHMMDYAWLQPAAISVGMGVNANMAMKDRKAGEEKTMYQLIFQSLAGGLRTVMENPMVTGLSNVVDATQDLITKQDGTKFKGILKGVPASFVPTVSNQLRTSVDNQQRETFDKNTLKEVLNLVQNKIPWWSKSLPTSYNSLGKEREKVQGGEANTLGQYLNAFINPTKSTSFEVTPEAKTVLDVLQDSGDAGVLPRIGAKYIMVDDPETKKQKKIDLTAEQFSKLQHSMGQMTVEKINQSSVMLNSSTVSVDKKAKKIKDILTSVGQKARNEIRAEMGYKKKKEN